VRLEDLDGTLVYVVLVGAIGAFVTLRVLLRLRSLRLTRSKQVNRRQRFYALRTKGPLSVSTEDDRSRALESIDRQFTVTTRVAVPILAVLTSIMMVLPFLGQVPTVVVSLLATVLAVVAGMAARPYIENAIAGLVISESKLMSVGDTVKVQDVYGTIEDITATHTTIRVWDWRRYVVPNTQMLQTSFYNYSLHDRFVWTAVDFWIAYDADVHKARALVIEAAKASPNFANFEEPQCWLLSTDKDAVSLRAAAWAETPSAAWELANDIRTVIAERFHAEGLRALGVRIVTTPDDPASGPAPAPPLRTH